MGLSHKSPDGLAVSDSLVEHKERTSWTRVATRCRVVRSDLTSQWKFHFTESTGLESVPPKGKRLSTIQYLLLSVQMARSATQFPKGVPPVTILEKRDECDWILGDVPNTGRPGTKSPFDVSGISHRLRGRGEGETLAQGLVTDGPRDRTVRKI